MSLIFACIGGYLIGVSVRTGNLYLGMVAALLVGASGFIIGYRWNEAR